MEDGKENNGTESQQNQAVEQQFESTGVLDALEGLDVPQSVIDDLDKLKNSANQQQNTNPGNTGSDTGTGEQEEQEEEEQEEEEQEEEGAEKKNEKKTNEQPAKKNVLGLGTKKQEKKADYTTENVDQILGVVKTKFGQEIKDVKDLPKFFEAASKWRADSQKVEEVTAEKEKLENLVSGLPEDIIHSMQLFYDGKDYTQAILNRPKFNFDLPVEKQDVKELVNHYFPNKFTDDDFTEETPSQGLEIAMIAAKDKFNTEKQTKDIGRAAIAANAQKQLESFNASLSGSVKNLEQVFPDIDKVELKQVHKTLEGGPNAIVQMFFNNDGTVKANAAEALMMALHGKSVIDDMVNAASHVTETRVNEEILSRGNTTRKPKNGNGAAQQMSDQAKKVLAELDQLKTNQTF